MKQETEMQIFERCDTNKILEELQPFPPQLLDLIRKAMFEASTTLLLNTLFKEVVAVRVEWYDKDLEMWCGPEEFKESELKQLVSNETITRVMVVERVEFSQIILK